MTASVRADPNAHRQAAAAAFDYDANRFPYSIVWQPFPVLGWILPCIGHMGIADSRGVIYDFQGPYTIMCVNAPRLRPSGLPPSRQPAPCPISLLRCFIPRPA